MPQERRQTPRKTPENLAYLSLPFNNGGIVIDVSEGGLGFHAIAPIRVQGPIRFRFAYDSSERITALGELVWSDDTGKAGGLRFTQLPDGAREKIRAWVGGTKADIATIPVAPLPAVMPPATAKEIANPPAVAPAVPLAPVPFTALREVQEAAAAPNPLLYSLKPPMYSWPANKLSMFPVGHEAAQGGVPPQIALPTISMPTISRSVPIQNPVVAVGITIALAFLVSIGLFTYVVTSPTTQFFLEWAEEAWTESHAQQATQKPALPVNYPSYPSNRPRSN